MSVGWALSQSTGHWLYSSRTVASGPTTAVPKTLLAATAAHSTGMAQTEMKGTVNPGLRSRLGRRADRRAGRSRLAQPGGAVASHGYRSHHAARPARTARQCSRNSTVSRLSRRCSRGVVTS